jgi:hypothetical protein
MTFAFAVPVMVPQGDGSFVVKPGKPLSELTVLQFAKAYGVGRSSVYNMIEMGVIEKYRRPLPKKILIPVEELDRLIRKSRRE